MRILSKELMAIISLLSGIFFLPFVETGHYSWVTGEKERERELL